MLTPYFILIGLGNPGKKYARTRHNVGFLALEAIAKLSSDFNFEKIPSKKAEFGWLKIEEKNILMVRPLDYMNQSGAALMAFLEYFKMDRKKIQHKIVVFSDDADLLEGAIKIKEKGGAGGHKGLESILGLWQTNNLLRIKIGIRPPKNQEKSVNFVLSPFGAKNPLGNVLEKIPEIAQCLIKKGPAWCQSHYNGFKDSSFSTVHEPQNTPR
jgi:PTH1 family peptidyl-tRNA hydrolase